MLFPAAPAITFQPDDGLATDGVVMSPLSVNLQCMAKGKPIPEISWYQNGDKIIPDDIISECERIL